jgi:uncharacterized protein YoxC
MEAILYISVAVVAVAFVVLVIYIIQTLKSLTQTLNHISHTVESLEGQLQGVTRETENLLKKTNDLAADIQQKSKKLDSVVIAVEEVGQTLQTFNRSINSISNKVIQKVADNQDKISQVISWGKLAGELKDKWSEIKERKKHNKEAHIVIDNRKE